MNKELRRVSAVVLIMFLTLFGSSTIVQVLQQDTLKSDPRNVRVLYASYSVERGDILVEGVPIAQSVPVDTEYMGSSLYEACGKLFAQKPGRSCDQDAVIRQITSQ